VLLSSEQNEHNPLVQFQFTSIPGDQQQLEANSVVVGGKSVPLLLVRNHRAKRYVLRLRPDGTARVTIPRGGSLANARQFAEKNVDWLQRQMQRMEGRRAVNTAWHVGTEILFRGETVTIAAGPESGINVVTVADQTVRVTPTGHDCRPAIERHLRRLATVELPPRVFQLAQQHSLTVQRVTVRNQKSRWGSCSRRGTVSLNWRLIQAPGFVADYIILHELMHLRQMNHSRKFWREVESVCPDFREAERWLKAHSRLLR
jgi:predicted metal-dependent hydrolase